MEEELSVFDFDNILSDEEAASLFADEEIKESSPEKEEKEKEDDNTAEADEELFPEEPESVGSEEHKEEKQDTSSDKDGPSPTNFYSSIASALKEEGIFPDIDDEEINNVKEPEDFRDIIDKQIKEGLEEAQKRIYEALNNGVQPSIVRQYENTLGFLNSITDEQIDDESEAGEELRKKLLQQDFMNRGYSQERAVKMTDKLFESGADIEEAKQALIGNKEFFTSKYNEILNNAKEEERKEQEKIRKQAEQLKKDILTSEKLFNEVPIDKSTRQKIYDNVSKPVYKDPETGEYYTALQKYKLEHENDFIKYVGLFFTLTDNFTNLDKLVSPSAKKEVKKKLKELEHTLNNTARDDGGVLKFVGNGKAESGSIWDKGYKLDI